MGLEPTDLLTASQALYQLSYAPVGSHLTSGQAAARLPDVAMSEQEWLTRYAELLGIAPPTDAERDQLLALAGVAAHSSARTAAPISTWLAARSGTPPERALELASQVAQAD